MLSPKEGGIMETLEGILKRNLLYIFCLLNAIDMVQTVSFLRMGIESNPYAVYYPHLWFPLKFLVTFGLPIGLYKLDVYLEEKEDEGFYDFLRTFVGLTYLIILIADVFFLYVVLRNISILGRII